MQLKIGLAYSSLAMSPRVLGADVDEEISGYGDHEVRWDTAPGGKAADNAFRIGAMAREFVRRLKSAEPIIEIHVTGHSDFVNRNGRRNVTDEDRVSQQRAELVWRALLAAILTDPEGLFTPVELAAAIRSGRIRVIVTGVGARQPLVKTGSPVNRRVQIAFFTFQSTDI